MKCFVFQLLLFTGTSLYGLVVVPLSGRFRLSNTKFVLHLIMTAVLIKHTITVEASIKIVIKM